MSESTTLMTLDEFCSRVRLSKRGFYSLRAKGDIPRLTRIGRRVLISEKALKDFLEQKQSDEQTV